MLALLAVAAFVAGCADGEDFGERPSAKKSRAAVESQLLSQVQSVADLAGSTVTDWWPQTSPCDIASPRRLWAMVARAQLPVPRAQQVAALYAVRDQWDRERRQFGDRRIAPDPALPDGDTGHLEAGASFGDASLIGSANQDHLDVIISSHCYDAVKGEDPGRG